MEDSFKKRYVIKLISTMVVVAANTSVQLILPRALSIKQYADYTYNLNVFTSVLAIAMLSMDGAFASKVSKRLKETRLILFYGKFLLLVALCLNIGICLVFAFGAGNVMFSNQNFGVVILALNASLSLKLFQEISSLYDCYALTRYSEPMISIEKVTLTVLVYFFYLNTFFNIKIFYLLQITLILLIGTCMLWWFYSHNKELFTNMYGNEKTYTKEFYEYCRPMVVAAIVSNLLVIVSNWLLKTMGGNGEQAYYGVAWQLNSLIVYTFSPIIALLQREFSVRVNNKEILGDFYRKILKTTILVVCFFSCFVIINADIILNALFGEKYTGAVQVTRLIMFYTIFQAWGQVEGAMYTASERTKVYARITITMLIVSIGLVYLFQIPNFIWPNSLGSIGMGLQKAVGNSISAMVSVYYNCKYLKMKCYKHIKNSFFILTLFLGIAFVCRSIIDFAGIKVVIIYNPLIQFIVYGCVYTAVCVIILFSFAKYFDLPLDKLKRRIN